METLFTIFSFLAIVVQAPNHSSQLTIIPPVVFTVTTSSFEYPPQFGNPNGTKFPGCEIEKSSTWGCHIYCDDSNFVASCASVGERWYCIVYKNSGETETHSGTGSGPCSW